MKKKDILIAEKLKNKLSRIVRLVDFKVFGSRAKGLGDEDSDLDVFIEVEQLDKNLEDQILHIAWEVGFDNYIVISPLIFTKDEIENTPLRSSDIVLNILEEGVAI